MTIYEKINANQAKINELRPFEGHMLKQLQDYYRVGLTWSSNALEGNTLTISETKVVLEDGLTIGGRSIRDFYETIGHGKAYDFMFTLIKQHSITIEDIKTMHRLFYRDIDEEDAGQWRKTQIVVSGSDYVFPRPQEIEQEMQLEVWMQNERDNYHPVEFAAMMHLKFVTIHPFIDGNGRTARLIMNLALIQDGYMLGIIPPICRTEYNAAIRRYQTCGNASVFCEFIGDRVYETQKEVMRLFHIR